MWILGFLPLAASRLEIRKFGKKREELMWNNIPFKTDFAEL